VRGSKVEKGVEEEVEEEAEEVRGGEVE